MPALYSRVFLQILDSSIAEDYRTRHFFEDLLKLADRDGVVDMTHSAIARRLNAPEAEVREAIAKLEAPDPNSRDPKKEGRRIERLSDHRDWGWRIINWNEYEAIRDRAAANERLIRHRNRKRDEKASSNGASDDTTSSPPGRFSEFWSIYPRREAKPKAILAWKKVKPSEVDLILKHVCDKAVTEDWKKEGGKYVPLPASYLNARRWEDEGLELARELSTDEMVARDWKNSL